VKGGMKKFLNVLTLVITTSVNVMNPFIFAVAEYGDDVFIQEFSEES
jgi:hypothetical protein